MEVSIKLNPRNLVKIKKQPKSMHLGNHLITQEPQVLDISEELLESDQCKHWMSVDDEIEEVIEEEVEEVISEDEKEVAEEVISEDEEEVAEEEVSEDNSEEEAYDEEVE